MTSLERVRRSLNHQEPDRIPVDFGSTGVTGMHVRVVAELRDYYGLEKRLVKAYEPYQMLGLVEEDLQDALGLDVYGIPARNTMFGFPNENWKAWTMDDGFTVLVSEHFKTKRDEDGGQLIFPEGDTSAPPSGKIPKGGYFFDTIIRQEPIDENNLNPEDNLEEFGLLTDADLAHFKQELERAKKTDRAIIANMGGTGLGDIALVPGPFMKCPRGIRDVAEWYMSTLTRQDYIHAVFSKQVEIALENLERFYEVMGEDIDILFICGTDFGTQDSQFLDAGTYKELYMPYYKKINDWIHRHTQWKTFKHSCGSVRPLIPAFIETGFDILNPVQVSAKDMGADELKKEYGQDIVFWGGGVDTQHELMFGTPEEVRTQVLKHCEIFGRDGGFVFNTVHNIQGNTPVQNVVALFDALHEFNRVHV